MHCLISVNEFRENIYPNNYFEMKINHPRLSVGESILLIHAQRTVIYDVVIVNRNFERTNENNGFERTALECSITFSKNIVFRCLCYFF